MSWRTRGVRRSQGATMRRSQFITTYGPGSIVETRKGPRMIPRPDIGLFTGNLDPKSFEIVDDRLEKLLGRGAHVFEVPSSDEMEDLGAAYKTKVFPEWWVCIEHGKLFVHDEGCPDCGGSMRRRAWDGIRFVMACPRGHLDDVDWHRAVHMESGSRGTCRPRYYEYSIKGPSLDDIEIRCPRCGSSTTVGRIYRRSWRCSGRYPEREPLHGRPRRPGCDERAKVIMRQASYVRIPIVESLFTLPPLYTKPHLIISSNRVICAAKILLEQRNVNPDHPEFHQELMSALREMAEDGSLGIQEAVTELETYKPELVARAFRDICYRERDGSSRGVWDEEFEVLIEVSRRGAPPERIPWVGSSEVIFEAPKSLQRDVVGPTGKMFRVAPITRLRAVLVQKGYERPVASEGVEMVDIGFQDRHGRNYRWYPGVQHLGEGIFLTSREVVQSDAGSQTHWGRWLRVLRSSDRDRYPEHLFRDDRERFELHPLFVWWHTLSHLIMRAMSVFAGYSSASLRERVYVKIDGEGGPVGGILIYTVQPGEGTMGGLVSLAAHFETILEMAYQSALSCPNDPLCLEQTFRPPDTSGAACYACTYVSETSCEHRNMWLDRNLLLEVPP